MINISPIKTADRVLADLALRHLLHKDRPEHLTRDNFPAILLLVENAFHATVAALVPHVADSSADVEADRLELTLRPEGESAPQAAIYGVVADAVEAYTLHLCYACFDDTRSEAELRRFTSLMQRARRLMGAPATLGTARPWWY